MATEQEGLEALNQIETVLQEQETVRGIPNLGRGVRTIPQRQTISRQVSMADRAHPRLWEQNRRHDPLPDQGCGPGLSCCCLPAVVNGWRGCLPTPARVYSGIHELRKLRQDPLPRDDPS